MGCGTNTHVLSNPIQEVPLFHSYSIVPLEGNSLLSSTHNTSHETPENTQKNLNIKRVKSFKEVEQRESDNCNIKLLGNS